MLDGIDVFWIWLGDLFEIGIWLSLGLLLSTALGMIIYTFNDFSNNLNTRKVMEGEPPLSILRKELGRNKNTIK